MGAAGGIFLAKDLEALSADGENGTGRDTHLFACHDEGAISGTGVFEKEIFSAMVDLGMSATHGGVGGKGIGGFGAAPGDGLFENGITASVRIQRDEFGNGTVQYGRQFAEILARLRRGGERSFIDAEF